MGLSSKQVSSDGLDWSKTLLQELPKPPASRRPPPQNTTAAEPLKCPRCDSTNTKFCYYNNYNKSQPRHFCKACKRHWTKGGTLRNVPVGGGRKNKRLKAPKATAKTATKPSPPSTNGNTTSQIMSQPLISQQNFAAGSDQSSILLCPKFHFPSSSSNFEVNPSLIPTSFGAPSVYNFCSTGETMEDSIVTSFFPGTSGVLMPQPLQGSNSRYWNWDDLDTFGPTDVSMPWDDSDLKP